MTRFLLVTYALLAIFLFAGAALLWIRRKAAAMRGHRLPRMRVI